MVDDSIKAAEVEIICPGCGYHMLRTARRLRRDTKIICPNCGEVVVPKGEGTPGPIA